MSTTEKKLKPMTNEELTIELTKTIQLVESLRLDVKEAQEDFVGMVNYVQELDAVTFVSLYLWTGKFKKTDIGKLSSGRVEHANALRINGRRALGEFREKQRIKQVKEDADDFDIYYDDNTPLEDIEKRVASEKAILASKIEQKRREEQDGLPDNNS